MGDEIAEMYQQTVIEHNKNPRNRRTIENATHNAKGANALCGDEIEVMMIIKDNQLADVAFAGNGCALMKASASIMTEVLTGKTTTDAEHTIQCFYEIIEAKKTDTDTLKQLDDAAIFRIMQQYPARKKCVTLAWKACLAAMQQEKEMVTTEEGKK